MYHLQFSGEQHAAHVATNVGKKYLIEHGLLSDEIVSRYLLGMVIDPLPGDERFRGWMAIPYLTELGVKAIRFRRMFGHGDKYGQAKGQSIRLFNPEACFQADEVIGIAEGEVDAIAATEFLGLPTVGVPGATQWISRQNIWKPIFKNFQRVYVLRDGDKAGKELSDAIVESLGFKAKVINMPNGMDVCSMLVRGRASELTEQFKD